MFQVSGVAIILIAFCILQAFFQRWWREQSDKSQEIVRKLVDSGQLEFMYVFELTVIWIIAIILSILIL